MSILRIMTPSFQSKNTMQSGPFTPKQAPPNSPSAEDIGGRSVYWAQIDHEYILMEYTDGRCRWKISIEQIDGTDRWSILIDRQTDTERARKTERQTDRQTDRQRDRHLRSKYQKMQQRKHTSRRRLRVYCCAGSWRQLQNTYVLSNKVCRTKYLNQASPVNFLTRCVGLCSGLLYKSYTGYIFIHTRYEYICHVATPVQAGTTSTTQNYSESEVHAVFGRFIS